MSISQAVYEAQIQRIADLQARLAEAETLLEIVAPLAYAQWKSGSCDPVEAVVGLNEPITGIADSADATHLRGVLRDVAGFNFATLEDCVGAARAALAADGSRRATRSASVRPEAESDPICVEADGCPTEMAVLKRFWREHQAADQSSIADEAQE